jgi:hypothetical protein
VFDAKVIPSLGTATRLQPLVFLIAAFLASPVDAQVTRSVEVRFIGGGTCNSLPGTISLVVRGKEGELFDLAKMVDPESKAVYWTGELPAGLDSIEASNTCGSARLHGARTDCQLSRAVPRKGGKVAAFTFNCDKHPAKDLDIVTSPPIDFGYMRRLPLNPTIKDSCECNEGRASRELETIPDVRFSIKPFSPRRVRTRRNLTLPTENLRLQLVTTKAPGPKDCGLLVNDTAVIAAANNGAITARAIVQLFLGQRAREMACQAPTLSSNAADIDERRLPGFVLDLNVKKDDR